MKYKTLFRLFVKALGLYLALTALDSALFALGTVSVAVINDWPGRPLSSSFLFNSIPALLQVGIGSYLFLRGEWIVNLAIPSNRPYCPECAYDLTGAASERCPECGTPFRWENVKPINEIGNEKLAN